MSAPPSTIASASVPAGPTRIPYAFARAHGVLALRDEGDAVLVLARSDASIEGIAELTRVLQRPLKTMTVNAERFAAELANAYNQGSPVAQFTEDLSRDTDLSRLLQDIPEIEDLLERDHDAPMIRMINALLTQALRERASDHAHRALRGALGGALSRRRHAARRRASRSARCMRRWFRA